MKANASVQLTREQRNAYLPVTLSKYDRLHEERFDLRSSVTFRDSKKAPVHRWFSYTQGFSPDLVRGLLKSFGATSRHKVLDPFCGVGTTNVVCGELGIRSTGVDVSPLMTWVAATKAKSWTADAIIATRNAINAARPQRHSPDPLLFQSHIDKCFEPRILGQLLFWRTWMAQSLSPAIRDIAQLALISQLELLSRIRKHGSHYRFLNNEVAVGVRKLNIPMAHADTNVKDALLAALDRMAADVASPRLRVPAKIVMGDARSLNGSVGEYDFVITSPPYLNRNNYIAQQKIELAFLGVPKTEAEFRNLVKSTFRSHIEAASLEQHNSMPEIKKILSRIQISQGNNSRIPEMIAGYFSDLDETLGQIAKCVKRGGRAAFVVGNSRWGGVVVPVDHLLAQLGEKNGFNVDRVLVTRYKGNSPQQMAKYGKIPVRESIVVLSRR